MLLDRDRIVGAALDRRVVGDDQHLAPRDAADAGDDAGRRRVVVVHVPRGERRELEKRRPWIEQPIDALAHRQLALLAMPLDVLCAAALFRRRGALAQLRHEALHPGGILLEQFRPRIDVRFEDVHYYGTRDSGLGRTRDSGLGTRDSDGLGIRGSGLRTPISG